MSNTVSLRSLPWNETSLYCDNVYCYTPSPSLSLSLTQGERAPKLSTTNPQSIYIYGASLVQWYHRMPYILLRVIVGSNLNLAAGVYATQSSIIMHATQSSISMRTKHSVTFRYHLNPVLHGETIIIACKTFIYMYSYIMYMWGNISSSENDCDIELYITCINHIHVYTCTIRSFEGVIYEEDNCIVKVSIC